MIVNYVIQMFPNKAMSGLEPPGQTEESTHCKNFF